MNENLSLGRIAGIHVGLNWSLLVIAFLIASSLATNFLPSAAPGQTSSAYWTARVISAFVYLVCLLAHELAHSIVATLRGVRGFSSDTTLPGAHAWITFVRPLTNLVLGVVVLRASAAVGGGANNQDL